ncbi:hypothetical protein ACFY9S_31810 [Streptomyces sp. NPDC012474]|uniref:hypothetical protein n=1 Tax=Streptomyces sp. NPDC012474 TaxID=3364836 RepID=UPI0036E642C9
MTTEPDPHLRVPDPAVLADDASDLLGVERLLQIVDQPGRVARDDPGRDGVVAVRDRFHGHPLSS